MTFDGTRYRNMPSYCALDVPSDVDAAPISGELTPGARVVGQFGCVELFGPDGSDEDEKGDNLRAKILDGRVDVAIGAP